MIGAVIYHVF